MREAAGGLPDRAAAGSWSHRNALTWSAVHWLNPRGGRLAYRPLMISASVGRPSSPTTRYDKPNRSRRAWRSARI